MKLQPLDVSRDHVGDGELNAGPMLLSFEAMFISQPLRLCMANCAVIEVISNANQRYTIALVANVSPR